MTPSRPEDPSIPDPPVRDSTGASAPKVDPEDLMLRAAPRPVTRINRRVLIALSGTGLLLILGATIFALDPPRLFDRDDTGRELYRTENNPTPDGLEALPRRSSTPSGSWGSGRRQTCRSVRARKMTRRAPSAFGKRGSPSRAASPGYFSNLHRGRRVSLRQTSRERDYPLRPERR